MNNERQTTRRWSIYLRDSPEVVYSLEERLSDLKNILNLSWSKILLKCVERGLEEIEKDPDNADKLDSTGIQIAKKFDEVRKREARKNRLIAIYQSLGLEAFREFCQKSGEDAEGFLEEYQYYTPSLSWDIKAEMWLREKFGDGQAYSTIEIRAEAERVGIITNQSENFEESSKDWARLRQLASRKGYASGGVKGTWTVRT